MKTILFLLLLIATTASTQTVIYSGIKKYPDKIGLVFYYQPKKAFVDSLAVRIKRVYGTKTVRVLKVNFLSPYEAISIKAYPLLNADTLNDQLNTVRLLYAYPAVVGITQNGIFDYQTTGLHRVDGLADGIPGKCAIISTVGLALYGKEFNDYLINVILHEIGHIYGLEHCPDGNCVMIESGDPQNNHLCKKCKALLKAHKL
jgi:predicted Zn-dependent protease